MNDLTTQTSPAIIPTDGMAPGLAILFDDRLYDKITKVAKIMAGGRGITPPHLLNAPEACFAVVVRSITWKLDPFFVAAATYQTPGGKVGFEGKLVHAILEASGKFEGQIEFEHIGAWDKIQGKWVEKASQKDARKKYAAAAWDKKDEEGLGVIVRAMVKGESEPRTMTFMLKDAYPRNAVTWATRPAMQILAPAIRQFAHSVVPGIFAGLPADPNDGDGGMINMGDVVEVQDEPAPTQGGPIDYIQQGREAYANGIAFRDAPGHLPAEAYDDWCKGWQAASADEHGEPEPEKSEPDLLPSDAESDAQQPALESGDEETGGEAVSSGKEEPAQQSAPRTLNEMIESCGKDVKLISRLRHAGNACKNGPQAFEDWYSEQFEDDKKLLEPFVDELRQLAGA